LQTFRSDIDYFALQAMTKYGVLGVKVWIEKSTATQAPAVQHTPSHAHVPAHRKSAA